jgi:hypothetical protein
MTQERASDLIKAKPGDGTFAGARRLYLERGLNMTLVERLRAVEDMAESAKLIQRAAARAHATK